MYIYTYKSRENYSGDMKFLIKELNSSETPSVKVLNWGRGATPSWYNPSIKFINNPWAVRRLINKLSTFKYAEQMNVSEFFVEHTESFFKAAYWLGNGDKVVQWNTVTGRKGRGMSLVTRLGELSPALMYTKYFPHTYEVRVHVLTGASTTVVGIHKTDRGVVELPDGMSEILSYLTTQFGLHFAGWDVLINEHTGEWRITEGNSAPGLNRRHNNVVAELYVNYFKEVENGNS